MALPLHDVVQVRPMRRSFPLVPFLVLLGSGCVNTDPSAAGMETAVCLDGACLGELECLSDLCVAPESGGTDEAEETASDPAGSTDPEDPGGSTSGGSTDPSGQETTDPTDPNPPDVTGAETGDPTGSTTGLPPSACSDVDVLFVIDNSGSMAEEQGRLAAVAPAFMDELLAITGSVDPHVMVIDVEPPAHPCDIDCALFQTCNADPEFVCGSTVEPTTCAEALGAGVGGPPDDCGFTSGGRYIDGSQPNLGSALDCALGIGTGSGSGTELTMQAMVEALGGPMLTQICNEGFLRDEAMLLVVFITDEDDDAGDSAGNPASWKVDLVDAKGGAEQEIFVLGLFGDNEFDTQACLDQAEYSVRLSSFVGLWGDRGHSGSVCAPDYAPFFDQLLGSVSAACG